MSRLEAASIDRSGGTDADPEGAQLRQRRAEVLLAVLETLPASLREAFVACARPGPAPGFAASSCGSAGSPTTTANGSAPMAMHDPDGALPALPPFVRDGAAHLDRLITRARSAPDLSAILARARELDPACVTAETIADAEAAAPVLPSPAFYLQLTRVVGLADLEGQPRFRLGGLELSLGLELALQFGIPPR